MATIKTGIVCDNYKVKKFEKELIKGGFSNYKLTDNSYAPGLKGTTTISIEHDSKSLGALKVLCNRVELHFKRGN